jgi:hypothetical protein
MRHLSLLPSSPFFPTASELRIASECVAQWALGFPEAEEAPGEWAEFGRRAHWGAQLLAEGQGMIEALARALPEPDANYTQKLAAILEHVEPMLERDLVECKGSSSGHSTWFVEQGIKWRPDGFADEAEFCERQPGERLRGWFSGTVDLAYVRADGVLVIVDWKFGPREGVEGEPAEDSCQGHFLALAFASKLGIRGSSAGVVVARFERRMVNEEGLEVDAYDITQGELDAFAEQLRGLTKRIVEAQGVAPRISHACGKCKAKATCPGWESLTSSLTFETMGMAVSTSFLPQAAEDAKALHFAIEAGERFIEGAKRVRDSYVLIKGPVPVGLGMVLKAIPSKDREALDTPEALDVIERIAGPKAITVQRKTTLKAIAQAARDSVGKNITSASDRDKTKKAAEERVFKELIEAGAVLDKGKKLSVRVVRAGEEE